MVVTKIKEPKKGMCVYILQTSYIDDGYLMGFEKVEKDAYRSLEGADALMLMTAYREFRELDLRRAKERMRTPIVIDGRRVFEAEGVRGLGFVYRGVGAGIQLRRAGNYIRSLVFAVQRADGEVPLQPPDLMYPDIVISPKTCSQP